MAGLLVVVPAAGRFLGYFSRRLEMITAPELQYFFVVCALVLLAALSRKVVLILLASVAFLFHGLLVLPWYFGGLEKDEVSSNFKVISFNLESAVEEVLSSQLGSGSGKNRLQLDSFSPYKRNCGAVT